MNFRKFIFAIALVSVSSIAFAGKVAVFDHEQAIMGTKKAQDVIKALEAKPEYAQLMAQIETLRADGQALAKEEQTKGMTWSNEKIAEHRKKMEYIQADLQLAAKKIQAENSVVAKKLMQDMAPKLEAAIKKVVDSEGIEVLLQKRATYFTVESADITKKIAVELDKAK